MRIGPAHNKEDIGFGRSRLDKFSWSIRAWHVHYLLPKCTDMA
ncbi:hypothetical protein Q427_11715 [Halomonas sp. BC04]|nr:hypothetical protein Q427_11715 [Halomonas sp. BC04]